MRTVCLLACLALAALALGACGSSGSSSPNSSKQSAGIRFADCMRSHGVPNFPDPGSGGGGIQIGPGVNAKSPAFQSAQSVCFKLLPGPGPGRGPVSEARKLQMLRLSRCMRAHGVPSFPDPTSSPPSAPPAGGGVAFGSPGSFISVPQSLIQSPAFSRAAAACGFPGVGRPGKVHALVGG